ncbi:hypothetical protein [Oribacterium sp. P9]|uniref:hypothetical protein n=1 Tax=Oribacterium sp. P9 TaxID=3378068 RepID=UPI003966BCCD
MNSSSESALVAQRTSRALTRSFILVIFLALVSSRSAMAAEPPNAAHPPSRTVSSSPALRTSRTRNALRPQSGTGWYYADDSRHWYYQVPTQSTSLLRTTAPSTSPDDAQDSESTLLKTGWHHDVDGFTYYFDPSDGHMLAGSHTIDGIEYSFLPERDRGNYHQDSLGAWFYRANGLAPYGSLLNYRSRNKRHSSPAATRPTNTDCDQSLIDSEDLVTDRLTIPPKASPSELTRDDDTNTGTTATPSELPRDEDSTATPSELPRENDSPATPSEPPRSENTVPSAPDPESPDPGELLDPPSPPETTDPETPAPPSDDRNHAHTSDPSVRCIATDDWSTILANRDAYGDCITNHCTGLLYLSGPPVSWPLPSTDTTTQDYPLYVSLVDDRDGQLTFAQAYAIPELSAVPMYVGTSLHDSESTPTYKQSNLGGICDTWLFRTLIGTGTKSPFRFYLEDDDGTYSQHEFTYPGYLIRIPEADESCAGTLLPLQSTKKYISRGYQAESPGVERGRYTTYLSDKTTPESRLPQLFTKGKMKSSLLWFPSAQELHEYTLTKMEENTYLPLDDDGDPLLSMYLKPERYIPALADSWRSDESYWLRSTPSAYLSEDTYAEQGMSDEATRDEYFLHADSTGNIRAAHYDDTAAVRLIFTVK